MKLNRAKALILVGTLSAVSCVVDDDDTDGNAGEAGEGSGGSSAGSAGKGGSSAGTSAGKGGSSGSGGSGSSGEGGSGGYAGADDCEGAAGVPNRCAPSDAGEGGMPGSGGAPSAGGAGEGGTPGVGGAYDGEGGDGGNAPSCDEEALPSVSCEGLSEFSCAADAFISDSCEIPEVTLKGYATDAVRSCMLGLTDAELCDDATNAYECLRSALEASCPDPSATADCDAIVSYCDEGSVDAAECATYLSGMNVEGRYQMVACIEAGTPSSCDLWSCVEGLTYPSVE